MSELVITEKDRLVEIADAIRDKAGLTEEFGFNDDFVQAINGIQSSNLITGKIIPTQNITSYTVTLDKKYSVSDFNLVLVFCNTTISAYTTSFDFYSAYALSGTQSLATMAYTKSSTDYLVRSTYNSSKFGNMCDVNNDITGKFDTITFKFTDNQITNGCVFSSGTSYIYVLTKI